MDRQAELSIMREITALKAADRFFLDAAETCNSVRAYWSPDRFRSEREKIFRQVPLMAAHASELAGPDSFMRRLVAGQPLLLTRDDAGQAHAFLNVCRHRGTRLVDDAKGCRKRFTCPYHAWTWNNRGDLTDIPHQSTGFPGLDRATLGLARVACVERHGWVWVSMAETIDAAAIDRYLAGLVPDFDWFDGAGLRLAATYEVALDCNWKILIEGGLESYHFKIAHRATIGPHFPDNLSTYQMFGDHIRSVLPRSSITQMARLPEDQWHLRRHANLLYTIFPLSQLLVQQDHTVWVHLEPLGPDRTHLSLRTLVPADDDRTAHWERNHAITQETLSEDFAMGESIQSGMQSGANAELQFGRFEGALHRFNNTVERMLNSSEGT